MSGKFWFTFGLILLLCASGCKSTGSGKDPLLGKTRLDPPTTNARSVYVERQNVNESGVVPGGRSTTTEPSTVGQPTSSDPAGIIQPGAGSVQTVNYPNGLDSAEEAAVSEASDSAESSRLRWRSAVEPEPAETGDQNLPQSKSTGDLTEEELTNYRYVYDFSVMPPRKVPVGRAVRSAVSEISDAEKPEMRETGPDPYVSHPRSHQLVTQNYDPYAPNRQFERRKAKLSRTLSAEFDDSEEFKPAPQTVRNGNPKNEKEMEPIQVAQTRSNAKDSGWRVVAIPETNSVPAVAPLQNEQVVDAQIAPVQQAVGTKVKAPEKVAEPVGKNESSALNLFDLPKR